MKEVGITIIEKFMFIDNVIYTYEFTLIHRFLNISKKSGWYWSLKWHTNLVVKKHSRPLLTWCYSNAISLAIISIQCKKHTSSSGFEKHCLWRIRLDLKQKQMWTRCTSFKNPSMEVSSSMVWQVDRSGQITRIIWLYPINEIPWQGKLVSMTA